MKILAAKGTGDVISLLSQPPDGVCADIVHLSVVKTFDFFFFFFFFLFPCFRLVLVDIVCVERKERNCSQYCTAGAFSSIGI